MVRDDPDWSASVPVALSGSRFALMASEDACAPVGLRCSRVALQSSGIGRTRRGRRRRRLDFISRIDPGFGAANYIQEIPEAELLRNAGGRARSIPAGAD